MAKGLYYLPTACRVVLAGLFSTHLINLIWPELPIPFPTVTDIPVARVMPLTASIIAGLMLLISIWLFFGIYSRLVAIWGVVIHLTISLIASGSLIVTSLFLTGFFSVLVITVPIILLGGGAYSMFDRKWTLDT